MCYQSSAINIKILNIHLKLYVNKQREASINLY